MRLICQTGGGRLACLVGDSSGLKTVDALSVSSEQLVALERGIRTHDIGVTPPDLLERRNGLFDREVRSEHDSIYTERVNDFVGQRSDACRAPTFVEHAFPAYLRDDVVELRKSANASAPLAPTGRRSVFAHARVIEDDKRLRRRARECGGLLHLVRVDL